MAIWVVMPIILPMASFLQKFVIVLFKGVQTSSYMGDGNRFSASLGSKFLKQKSVKTSHHKKHD